MRISTGERPCFDTAKLGAKLLLSDDECTVENFSKKQERVETVDDEETAPLDRPLKVLKRAPACVVMCVCVCVCVWWWWWWV